MRLQIIAWLYWTAALTVSVLAGLAMAVGNLDRGLSLAAIGGWLILARAMTLLVADQQQIRLRQVPPREREPK